MLNTQELAEATKEFDQEFIGDTFGPPPPEAKAQWQRARRKRGRPRQGAGVKVISVSLEKGLLKQSDALARKLGVSRAALIADGLRKVIATQAR
jgi:hypothetical protein